MSGNADSIGPNEGEVSTANISAADEEDYSENLTTRCLVKDNGDHPLLTSATKSDSPLNPELEASEDFEAVIEKKLNPEKEKALDIDSELDFELKWDDDALNDDETDSKSDDAQCVTTENETIEEDNIIESQINPDNDESNNGNMNKVLDTVDKTPPDDEHTSDIKILESKVNTNMKINLASKLLMDSENSSLDEQLVYSDVDVPDIEDKQLLDEIDAHISDKTANDENTNVETSRSPTAMPELNLEKSIGEGFSQQDLNSTEMDVDVEHAIKISDTIEKIDVNDTCSTITDMETSSYEINVQHKLVKLDAMIEIPTQELIEEFDDSGELSEGAEQYDEELLLQNHPKQQDNSSGSIKDVDNIKTSEQVKPEDETLVKQVINIEEQSPDVKETLVANAVNEMVEVIQTENTEMKSSSPDNNEHNDNLDIKDIEITDGERHAMHGIIIEAAQQEPVNLKEMKDEKNDSEPTEKLNAENSSFLELGLIAKLPAALTETVSTIDAKAEVNLTADTSIKEIEITEDIQSKMIIEEEDITSVAAVDNLEPREPTETKCILSSNVEPKKIDIKTKEELKVDDSSGDIEPKGHKESKKEVPTNLDSKENIESKGDGSTDDMDSKGNMKTKDISSVDDRKVDKEIKNVIPTDDLEAKMDIENKEVSSTDNLEPKADIEAEDANSTDDALPKKTAEMKNVGFIDPAQPSTSNLLQELSDEDQVTDSLGLLAESSRVMDDDDEQEQEDDDDDEDFDQDDESNQMTAEHSEDSSAQQSETDAPQESMDVDQTTDVVKETIQCQTPEPVSSKITEPVEPIVAESVEAMEDEVESAVLALMSSNATEELTDMPDPPRADGLSAEGQAKLDAGCKLRELLTRSTSKEDAAQSTEKSPSKVKKLEISRPNHEYSIVDLEESSSEDDVQEVSKSADSAAEADAEAGAGAGAEAVPVKLDTSEGTVKAAPPQIPPTVTPTPEPQQPKLGLEIFNLDSDDDEKDKDSAKAELGRDASRCINAHCTSGAGVPRVPADAAAAAHYGAARRRAVCAVCARAVRDRTESLIAGVRELTPLLSLDMGQVREELVEISDSESDSEADAAGEPADAIGEAAAKFLEANLEEVLNATWLKYNLDSRLQEAQVQLDLEVSQLEDECKQIDAMLGECQSATDRLRRDLYATFQHERQELPAIIVYDTPTNMWCSLEESILANEKKESRQSKRRLQASAEPAAKRAAIPLEYSPLDKDGTHKEKPAAATDSAIQNDDDSADISVVRSSAEAAPAGLPPPGAPSRPPLRAQAPVYAMRNAFGAWLRARVVDVLPRTTGQFTMCRVKFEHKVKSPFKLLPARCLAYDQPSDVRMTIGTRVIALFADTQSTTKSYYSGIIAEIPNPVNNYRYLVFFDDGYAQYVQHAHTRPVCECAPLVWDEVHPLSRQFVRDYLRAYPERPMVRAHAGQSLKTEWNGKWWVSRVLQVDASLVQVHFEEDDRTEWIYRGSTRLAPLYLELQAAERQRARPLPRAQPGRKVNMPYVEYTRSDEPAPAPAAAPASAPAPAAATATAQLEDVRRQRAVAKKSTAQAQPAPPAALDGVSSRVVFYTPKNAIRPLKMVPHTCGPRCRRTDVLALKDLRTYNPLTKPLLSGWERQIVKYRFTKAVVYRAPCGRRVRDARELHRYLRAVGSDMPVDLFDFGPHTHCLAEFVLNKCLVSKKDLSHGKENVPVPCVNYYDSSLPEFCSYSTERTPTAGVPLNLDPEFLCGCDCADDCADKQKCACWRMTLEGARTIGLDSEQVGYVYKRLPEPLPSGIYECNSRCKCKNTCLNRVAQHPLQLKLQVFKTLNRGWGIRALNDVPKGAFLCVYAGNLLTDATANLDGLNEGDEYLAELDYIEVVEQMKEGYEEDIPEADKKLDEEESSESASSSEEERAPPADDEEFRPAERLPRATGTEYSKRLRKREKKKKEGEDKEKTKQKEKEGNTEDNCITISDDEELREPARFAAQAGMGGKEFVSKYKSVRAHFGKDEACYIMDAKVQGNIGRYLNHSCTPNVFVQNVFVDTHDPRFPWVAFFALTHIRAGTELTWNYNYDVGSVPGKVLYCHCAAPNCRGRLL